MNLFTDFSDRVRNAVYAATSMSLDVSKVVVEPTRDPAHGDLATNAALVLAKEFGSKPRDLAELIVGRLREDPDIAELEIAGPGFINMRLGPNVWPTLLERVLEAGDRYGSAIRRAGGPVNVEYVSANPTGPMHVGHCRGAVFGDALCNLLAFAGFDVTREYYVNDAGAQVDVLARSAFLRYREALGQEIGTIPEGLYPGDYLKPVGQALADLHGDALLNMPEAEWLPLVRAAAIDSMLAMIRDDLEALNIRHDVFFSERSLTVPEDKVSLTLADLRDKNLVYEGRLPPPKGQLPEDWEDREQTLFRTVGFGDDVDRPLVKSDGTFTYFASDVAYMRDKLERGFSELIFVLGADHGGYVKRLEAVGAGLSAGLAHVDVKLVQLVRLFRAGEPVRMSKRSGDFVTLRDVVDEVGRDAVRFMMLFRKNDAVLDFDFAKVVEQSRENPVFYVQYAHARARSVLRNAAEAGFSAETADLSRLSDAGEIGLIRRIAEFPRMIEAAALTHEPHRIAFYLHDLASDFHSHWNRGNDATHLRFIIPDDSRLTNARLALVLAFASVLSTGLGLLGVAAPEEMR
ncbi:arginine--tRNA ligase [Terrihabitans rhizophilus]|uniref:Arginine--tRNA ligase n=1 Tax=Terrihabitans rhizophilus TaxID=3092662 RepID=A0ABU4RVF8_9HYPH|nr:arginine--tRNA ligase [Terrihabitans sp. PJ23]MDX6807615.1 arginine--tRNA ligase [Terrihabitans sp. PJ23]